MWSKKVFTKKLIKRGERRGEDGHCTIEMQVNAIRAVYLVNSVRNGGEVQITLSNEPVRLPSSRTVQLIFQFPSSADRTIMLIALLMPFSIQFTLFSKHFFQRAVRERAPKKTI